MLFLKGDITYGVQRPYFKDAFNLNLLELSGLNGTVSCHIRSPSLGAAEHECAATAYSLIKESDTAAL